MAIKGRKQSEKEKKRESKTRVKKKILAETQDREAKGSDLDTQIPTIERDLELLRTELRVVEPEKKVKEQEAARLRDILPSWVEKQWMYVTPTVPDQFHSWSAAWGDFLLEFAEFKAIHVLNLLEIRKEFPFFNRIIKKKLSIDQLQQVGQTIIERDFGAWLDARKTRLRIYWKGLDEWSEIIYEWALRTGRETVTLFDLLNASEIWSTLSKEELNRILKILVTRKLAEWVGKEETTILFHF